jgi:hypothetical protein
MAGARTIFTRLIEEAAGRPGASPLESEAGWLEVTAAESTRREDRPPGAPPRGHWTPRPAAVWARPSERALRPPPLPRPEDTPGPDPLAPRATVSARPQLPRAPIASRSDGTSFSRKSLPRRPDVPTKCLRGEKSLRNRARGAGTAAARTPGPVRAMRLLASAQRSYSAGHVFDARADALLAQVFDPKNDRVQEVLDRWEREIRAALG